MHNEHPEICPSFTDLERIEIVRFISTAMALTLPCMAALIGLIALETWILG
jgi:hypothetical protein